jgi:RNA polymerase sigma factor (sigma-70 family)
VGMINTTDNLTLPEKEELIQPLLKRIAENNSEDIKYFFELFSDEIYNFPIKYYNFSEDDAGEFYLYAFEHLKNGKKIASFKHKSRFTTWLFSVLRNLVIDFLRKNKNKLKFSSLNKTDSDGNVINVVDNIPDIDYGDLLSGEDDTLNDFLNKLNSMKIYNRVLFKLAFIQFIDLSEEEVQWLCDNNKVDKTRMYMILSKLKDTGFEKSNAVRDIEDKLTSNFQMITSLENKINNFFKDHPSLNKDMDNWSEHYENKNLPGELLDRIRMLVKKKKKHVALLQNQKKSLFCTRLPYKSFAYLLNTADGVLSVQLLRIIEKLNPGI